MISSIVEILLSGGASATAVTAVGAYSWFKQRTNIKPDARGKYLWKQIYRDSKFHCPKCLYRTDKQPKICSCNAHKVPHFHHTCKDANDVHSCGATIIIRTYDDY